MKLLLDMGNTRLKWALQEQPAGWLARGAVDWQPGMTAALDSAWADLGRVLSHLRIPLDGSVCRESLRPSLRVVPDAGRTYDGC
jgi:hypothetical protein